MRAVRLWAWQAASGQGQSRAQVRTAVSVRFSDFIMLGVMMSDRRWQSDGKLGAAGLSQGCGDGPIV